MKKGTLFVTVLAIILAVSMFFAGCGNVGICDGCGQKASLTKYVSQCDSSEHYHYCDDCLKWAKFLGE